MFTFLKYLSVSTVLFVLFACGGGSSDTDSEVEFGKYDPEAYKGVELSPTESLVGTWVYLEHSDIRYHPTFFEDTFTDVKGKFRSLISIVEDDFGLVAFTCREDDIDVRRIYESESGEIYLETLWPTIFVGDRVSNQQIRGQLIINEEDEATVRSADVDFIKVSHSPILGMMGPNSSIGEFGVSRTSEVLSIADRYESLPAHCFTQYDIEVDRFDGEELIFSDGEGFSLYSALELKQNTSGYQYVTHLHLSVFVRSVEESIDGILTFYGEDGIGEIDLDTNRLDLENSDTIETFNIVTDEIRHFSGEMSGFEGVGIIDVDAYFDLRPY